MVQVCEGSALRLKVLFWQKAACLHNEDAQRGCTTRMHNMDAQHGCTTMMHNDDAQRRCTTRMLQSMRTHTTAATPCEEALTLALALALAIECNQGGAPVGTKSQRRCLYLRSVWLHGTPTCHHSSRRRDFCHFADTLSLSIPIETPANGRGGCSRTAGHTDRSEAAVRHPPQDVVPTRGGGAAYSCSTDSPWKLQL